MSTPSQLLKIAAEQISVDIDAAIGAWPDAEARGDAAARDAAQRAAVACINRMEPVGAAMMGAPMTEENIASLVVEGIPAAGGQTPPPRMSERELLAIARHAAFLAAARHPCPATATAAEATAAALDAYEGRFAAAVGIRHLSTAEGAAARNPR